jgi:hypothetical protein
MDHLNLVLKFRLADHDQYQVKGASRIKVDGCGSLTFYDVQSGNTERIDLGQLRSLTLYSAHQAVGWAA